MWSEGDNFDLALSFQEKAGCDEIWEKICSVSLKLIPLLYGGGCMCRFFVCLFFGWGAGRGRKLTCFEREILIRRWQAVGIFYFYVVLFAGKCLKNLPIRRLLVCSHFQLGGMFGCRPKPASLVYFALKNVGDSDKHYFEIAEGIRLGLHNPIRGSRPKHCEEKSNTIFAPPASQYKHANDLGKKDMPMAKPAFIHRGAECCGLSCFLFRCHRLCSSLTQCYVEGGPAATCRHFP